MPEEHTSYIVEEYTYYFDGTWISLLLRNDILEEIEYSGENTVVQVLITGDKLEDEPTTQVISRLLDMIQDYMASHEPRSITHSIETHEELGG